MAAHAAHLTRTLNDRPSIFEVAAQESLHSTIEPALRKVAEFIVSCNRQKFGWLLKWFDEVYLLFNTVLQYNYLQHYAASFAESFYGLQRFPLKSQMFNNGHLPSREEKMSLFFLVVFPYMRQKLNQLAEKYKLQELDGLTPKSWKGIYQKLLIKIHAAFHFLFESICLIQYLAYMSGKSASHSPLLKMASLTLNYQPNSAGVEDRTWSDFFGDLRTGNFNSARVTFGMIGTVLVRSMEIGAFFIQFLKWWEDRGPHMEATTLPVPDPPKADIRASQYLNRCPICLQSWKIPTVLPVSGYVFCYKCIVRHLNEDSRCPVTKYPARINDLTRIYM